MNATLRTAQARMMTYEQLFAAGIVPWPYSTFAKRRAADPDFPRGLKDGRATLYNAEDFEAYWDRRLQERDAEPGERRPADHA